MSTVLAVLPLIVVLAVACVLPFASERVVERVLAHSDAWQRRSARSRRQLSRTVGLLVVMAFAAVYVFTNQTWL